MGVLIKIVGAFFAALVLSVIACSITGLFVMWLWNAVIPDLFHLPTITWVQAWCLAMLCAFLFKTEVTTSK